MNLNKELRKYIYVNDSSSPYESLDFSGMHLRLAYHSKKQPYEGHPYILKGYGQEYKKLFKTVGLVALNAANTRDVICASKSELADNGIHLKYEEVKGYLNVFRNYHSDIKDCFCSDTGIKLMYYDSEIIEDCIHSLMIKGDIVVLPVHDELLCPVDKVDIVRSQMEKSYRKILKRELKLKKILGKNEALPEDIRPVVDGA